MTEHSPEYLAELERMRGYGDKPQGGDIAEQGSPAWLAERCGHVTASRFSDVLDVRKDGKPCAKRIGYIKELIVERLTDRTVDHPVSKDMERGKLMEPIARIAYEAKTCSMVDQTGFLHHKEIKWCGGSPDGLVNDDGLIEIKCPRSTTHVETWLTAECDYLPQIQGLLWITGRQWCDFVSYDPEMPDYLQIYVQRIKRDENYIAALALNVKVVLEEVHESVTMLTARAPS